MHGNSTFPADAATVEVSLTDILYVRQPIAAMGSIRPYLSEIRNEVMTMLTDSFVGIG